MLEIAAMTEYWAEWSYCQYIEMNLQFVSLYA